MIRKAVIPAAGLGTRCLPATKAQPKEKLPVVDKPVIQYVVEEAIASGIKDFLIITGKGKRAVENHFGKSELNNKVLDTIDEMMSSVNLFYTPQREPRGLGDAVYCAKSFVGDETLALFLGDTITNPECTTELIKNYGEFKTSIIAVEGDTYLVEDLVEKPSLEEAPSNLGILGRSILTPARFEVIERMPLGKGNEIQLTDALRRTKEKIYAYVYRGKRYDGGNKLDWLKSNSELSLADDRFKDALKTFFSSICRGGIKDEHKRS
jgi:UTP--glucose-1-phosphate uridylyltransferase